MALLVTNPSPPSRPLHPMERAWLVAERQLPGFVISLELEGEGQLDPEAVRGTLALHPGMAGRVVGVLGQAAVRCDRPPRIAAEQGPLDPHAGPAAEIVLRPGRVIFRAHHAIADGRAIQRWAEDTFASLRGEPVQAAKLAIPPPATRGAPPPRDQRSLFGPPDPTAPRACHDARIRIDTPPRGALRRVLQALWARRPGARISLPVDLRDEDQSVDGNMTGIAHASREDELQGLRARATDVFSVAEPIRWLPLSLLERGARDALDRTLAEDRFDAVATVSNLGRLRHDRLSAPGFQARRGWWVPPRNLGNPLLILVSGDEHGLDVSATAPLAICDPPALQRLLRELAEHVAASRAT